MIKKNKYIEVHITEEAKELVVIERKTGMVWKSNPPLLTATSKGKERRKLLTGAKMSCQPFSGGFKITVRGKIEVKASILLQGDCLRFRIDSVHGIPQESGIIYNPPKLDFFKKEKEVCDDTGTLIPDESIVEIDFPLNLGFASNKDEGYLVLPYGIGKLCKFESKKKPVFIDELFYWNGSGGLTMPFFGIVKGGKAIAALVKTPFDAKLKTKINKEGEYSITPSFIFEAKRLLYPREVIYYFLPSATYVDIAKVYRRELIKEGKFVTLREKAEKSPEVEKLAGAVVGQFRSLRTGFATKEYFREGKAKGFDRIVIYSCLAPAYYYDFRKKIEVPYGEIERYAKSLSEGFRHGVYINFCHLSPKSGPLDKKGKVIQNPSIILTHKDGSLQGVWVHGDKLICPPERIKWAKQRLPELKKEIGSGSIYIDIEGNHQLDNCYHPSHPMTREDDANYRKELLGYAKKLFGTIATEELPAMDFLCDTVDLGYYFPVYQQQFRPLLKGLVPVPLYQLVYHDSLIDVTTGGWLEDWPGELHSMCEPLHIPLYGLGPDDFSKRSLIMSKEMRETYYKEMLKHEFLTGPKMKMSRDQKGCLTEDVQMSTFADGTKVIANFTASPYVFEKTEIGAKGLLLIIKDKKVVLKKEEMTCPICPKPYFFKSHPGYLY